MDISTINPNELSNVMRQYYDIKVEYKDKVVMFQLGDFYEMFFEDAIKISKDLELTLTSKKAGLKERIPMCGIPLNNLKDYVQKMINLSYEVVVVDQVEEDSLGKKIFARKVRQIISNSTYIKDSNDNNFIGAINYENKYNLSYADIATGELYYLETTNFNDIHNEIVNQNIKEVIVDNTNKKEELEILKKDGIFLKSVVDKEVETNIQFENKSQENLIKYLDYVQVGKITQFKSFKKVKLNKYMQMSANAQKQLEILQTAEEGTYKNGLYWYLNNTSTAMGKRLLKNYLIHPLIDEEEILLRQKIVSNYIKSPMNLEEVLDLLKQIYDFERLIGKVTTNTITPREIEKLKISLQVLPELYNIVPTEIFKLTNSEKEDTLSELCNYLNRAIKVDSPITLKDGGFVKPGFNKEVDELRNLKDNSSKWLVNFENEEIEKTGIKNLKVKYNKVFGYFIEVTNSNISLVPEYYVEKQTLANCKRYITETLKVEENKILNAHDMLLKLELELFSEIKKTIQKYILKLQKAANLVSTVDVLTTFALNAINDNLVQPQFNKDNIIDIKGGVHPIVQKNVDSYIKNDLSLDEKESLLLITGPNMAGKSTYMRMVSLIVIMAQIGSYVPAEYANLKLINSIFTRIGAGDNLSKGKSTFMVEMLETAQALENADENSLIIFDELGRGTSTYDGVSLAQAIIKYICENIKCKTLFSTHYHELVQYSEENKNIKLVHVKALEEAGELKFYHKVMPGSISKSYGIEVASLAGVNSKIIKEAKKNYLIIASKENDLNINTSIEQEIEKVITKQEASEKNEKLLNIIKNIDLNNLTPMQCMSLLSEIKDEYDKL